MIGYLNCSPVVAWTAAGGTSSYRTMLREGLRCAWLDAPQGGRWVLDEFPLDVFPGPSTERWDAIHYGLPIDPLHVTTRKEV